MVPEEERHPFNTTTKGLGELMRAALDEGYRKFIVGLGGSATSDGGMGMLGALGARFQDEAGRDLAGFGRDLAKVRSLNLEGLDPRLKECKIIAASDVRNPLCGPSGASRIFGLQKGASADEAVQMDQDMARYAGLIEAQLGRSLQHIPGAGAAGGLGFALLALGAEIRSGASLVEEVTGLREKLVQADWVITGEGRSDSQSMYGKLPVYIAKIAKECGIPAILISGSLGDGAEQLGEYFAGCFAIVREPASLQDCMKQAEPLLYACACNVLKLLKQARKSG
jgi:glycerate kinase